MEDNRTTEETPTLDTSADSYADELRRFTLWAIATLNLHVEREDTDVFVLEIPEPHHREFENAAELRFTFSDVSMASPVERITVESPLLSWLVACLQRLGNVAHAVPVDQPTSVHTITPQLFSAYTIDNGRIRLEGCSLDDVPLLRLTYRSTNPPSNGDAGRPPLIHVFVNKFGKPVEPELLARLQLERIGPVMRTPPQLGMQRTEQLIAAAKAVAAKRFPDGAYSPMCATVVWCKYAAGKLAVTIGDESVELPFAGWAQMLADGTTKPPRYSCKLSGLKSYHLTATDDGRITVAEAIGRCCESDSRVLNADLERCAATGKRALPRYLTDCPVSQERVLQSALVECEMCRQGVSPTAIESGRCRACRGLTAIGKDEPRIARALGEYPALDVWRNWQIAETTTAYVLVASALVKRLIVVLDKQTLEPLHLATASRWRTAPRAVEPSRWSEYLG